MEITTITQVDRQIVGFEVRGHPCPYKHTLGPSGSKWVTQPNKPLKEWQRCVMVAARAAYASYARPYTGEVFIKLTFIARGRNGEPDGSPWITTVGRDGKKGDPQVPDLDNLVKAVLDGMEWIVLGNDVIVAGLLAEKIHGQMPGVRVEVYAL